MRRFGRRFARCLLEKLQVELPEASGVGRVAQVCFKGFFLFESRTSCIALSAPRIWDGRLRTSGETACLRFSPERVLFLQKRS